jgi:hypothetical protein
MIMSANGHFLIRRRPEKRIMRTHPFGFSKVTQARDGKSSLFVTSLLRSLHAKTSERSFKVLEKGDRSGVVEERR